MSQKTVLYVEDNEYNRKIVRQLLSRTSYRLLEAPAKGARAWLMTIAIRVALTRLRRRKMSRFLLQVDEQGAEQTAEPASTPEHRDLVSDVYRVLDELPVELRAAWVLRHIQEETVQGVADLCGWSLSTAKRRLQAAEAVVTARLHARSSSRSR